MADIPLTAPGILFSPLDWTATWMLAALERYPMLAPRFFDLTPKRMHLIACALSHGESLPALERAPSIVTGPAKLVLEETLGHRPQGLSGALDSLSPWVLKREAYRALLELLTDSKIAKRLSHAEAISEDCLMILNGLSPRLRCLAFEVQTSLKPAFAEGLTLLAARHPSLTYGDLLAELETSAHCRHLRSKVRTMIEELPLPDALPPIVVARARRLDSPSEIRRLAKRWRNCLTSYTVSVDQGVNALYLWQNGADSAVAMLRRFGRLGWFVDEIKGADNCDLPGSKRQQIEAAFEAVGIPRGRLAEALEELVEDRRRNPFARRVRPITQSEDW